jgi:biotin synthesis protein BioG
MEQELLKVNSAYAINGTLNPVSDLEGIPTAIFEGTVSNLTEVTMKKFMMRICGGARGYAELAALMPRRQFEEQKEELILLGEYFQKWPLAKQDTWLSATIATEDLIFPYQNMKNHWGDRATTISGAHLCFGKVASWGEMIG